LDKCKSKVIVSLYLFKKLNVIQGILNIIRTVCDNKTIDNKTIDNKVILKNRGKNFIFL